MCGRYKLEAHTAKLVELFSVDDVDPDVLHRPRYNAAPTQRMPLIFVAGGRRRLSLARWGLIPVWAKSETDGPLVFNARAETAHEKRMFRGCLERHRCLVPSDGFYEWIGEHKARRPVLIRREDNLPFAFAGLFSAWRGHSGEMLTFTILTTAPNDLMAPVHDRMPVILESAEWSTWLDPSLPVVDLARLSAPTPWGGFVVVPVSKRLGNVRNDDPSVLVDDLASVPHRAGREAT